MNASHSCQPTRRRGAAAVEFAFAVSVLLMVVFASIEFVRLNMLEHCVNHASYVAARKGIVIGATVAEVQAAAVAHLDLFGLSGASVTVSPNPISDDSTLIDVHVEVPMIGNSWIAPIYYNGTMTGRTRMLADRAASKMAIGLLTGG